VKSRHVCMPLLQLDLAVLGSALEGPALLDGVTGLSAHMLEVMAEGEWHKRTTSTTRIHCCP
jgi:hypothetical protein